MLNIAAASSSEMRPMSSLSRSESCETNSLRFGSRTLRQRWVAEDKIWVEGIISLFCLYGGWECEDVENERVGGGVGS